MKSIIHLLEDELFKVQSKVKFYAEEESKLLKMLNIAGQPRGIYVTDEQLKEASNRVVLDLAEEVETIKPTKEKVKFKVTVTKPTTYTMTSILEKEMGRRPSGKEVNTAFSILLLKKYVDSPRKGVYRPTTKGKSLGIYSMGATVKVKEKAIKLIIAAINPLFVKKDK